MLPLTVLSRRSGPPSPRAPSTRRRVRRVVVIDKSSVVIRPLAVRIARSALICSGTSTLILPFTVSNVASPFQVSPNDARIDRLTVVALAPPRG